jgi:flagellar basal body-associated protein FliL
MARAKAMSQAVAEKVAAKGLLTVPMVIIALLSALAGVMLTWCFTGR